MTEATKIAVAGAGRVGSTFVFALAQSGLAREIVLIDAQRSRAEGEAMDIAHATPFYAPVSVRAGELADAAGAAATVIAAGAAQREGIDSISLNPDSFVAAARCVAETETRLAGERASAVLASVPDRPSIANRRAAAEEAN